MKTYSIQYINERGNIVNKEYNDGIEFFFYLSTTIYLLKAGKITISVKEVENDKKNHPATND